MASTFSGTIKNVVSWINTQPLNPSGTTVVDQNSFQFLEALTDGSASNQAHQIYYNTYTTATTANNDLDLTSLSQTVFGGTLTVTFSKLSLIWIANANAVSLDRVVLLASATNGFAAWGNGVTTSAAVCGPSSNLQLSNFYDPWTVDGTHKILRINVPGANSVTYNVILIGS
jgi:hypothetical protein